jgi:hypothetical protein
VLRMEQARLYDLYVADFAEGHEAPHASLDLVVGPIDPVLLLSRRAYPRRGNACQPVDDVET